MGGVGEILCYVCLGVAARLRVWALFHLGAASIALPGPENLPVSPRDVLMH